MPIIVSRKTGEIISTPEYSQEQKNRAWEIIIEKNAEKILAGLRPDPEPGRESPVRNVAEQGGGRPQPLEDHPEAPGDSLQDQGYGVCG